MRKRTIPILVLAIVLTLLCFPTIVCYAAEGEEPEADQEIAEALETPAEKNNLFSRAWEFVVENRETVTAIIGDIALFAIGVFTYMKNRKRSNTISGDLKLVAQDASGTHDSQVKVVNAVNDMIDGYGALKESYDKYGALEGDRDRLIGAIVVTNTAILEILQTVYANSKNMPQGIKDIVNLKYANCLKAMESDETLKSVVAVVRDTIGIGASDPGNETDRQEE